jgi:hypothetical protein
VWAGRVRRARGRQSDLKTNWNRCTLPQLGDLVDWAAPCTLRTGIPGDNLGGVSKTEDLEEPTVHPEDVCRSGG